MATLLVTTDSTASSDFVILDILHEWRALRRKGKVILHSDGEGIKRIEFDYFVDFIQKSTRKRNLVNGNYNDKPASELNYIFRNNLYDNTVKLLGKASLLGKECNIFEIRIGIEKLEVYEWQGVFLKTKRFMCADGANCNQPLLMHEETATQIRENLPIGNSIFDSPEQFELIIN